MRRNVFKILIEQYIESYLSALCQHLIFAKAFALRTRWPVPIHFRPYQIPIFQDNTSGISILYWSRQIGKNYVLATWAVDRLLTRLGATCGRVPVPAAPTISGQWLYPLGQLVLMRLRSRGTRSRRALAFVAQRCNNVSINLRKHLATALTKAR